MFPLCPCGYQLVEHLGPWRPQDIAPEGEHTSIPGEQKGCGYWGTFVWEMIRMCQGRRGGGRGGGKGTGGRERVKEHECML